MIKVGVIGLGYVGEAVLRGFERSHKVHTFDIAKQSTETSTSEVSQKADVIFICVPTPMNKDGSANIDIVRSVLTEVSNATVDKKICVIKSTVPPTTTQTLAQEFPKLSIAFNPEFLTERNYINDFLLQENIILGYNGPIQDIQLLVDVYREAFPNVKQTHITDTEAELVKYLCNTFLSTKVAYLNEFYQICNSIGVNYNNVIYAVAEDERLGTSHWKVPGPDGKFGFGGTCFPKDLNALIQFSKSVGQNTPLLEAVWEKNLEVRPEKDWELDKGRAVI